MKKVIKFFVPAAMAAMMCGCAYDMGYNVEMGYADPMVEGEEPVDAGKFDEIVENDFIKVADEPVSTFSVDADGASYSYIKRCITHGESFNAAAARIEEFINYFPFDYAEPTGSDLVALNSEIGDCPWAEGHKIIRLGMKGKSIPDNEMPTANYVFLVDVSGSMDSEDKLDLLKSGLVKMLDVLNPDDRISIVTYSGEVKKVLESTPVSKSADIKKAIRKLTAGGSTAGGQAMKMAYEEAKRNYIAGGNNRVIMGTDGDFNVGVTDTDSLLEMVQDYAKTGIYLTICGFGWGNLNDSMMETVSNKGNGTYEYIADGSDMTKIFVNEKSKFFSVANDCKVQVKFNPETVSEYRLIGYENRAMSNEDFDNDDKDAAEIGAGQTVTALYEIIPAEGYGAGAQCATFDFRYKETLDSSSLLLAEEVKAQGGAGDSFSFACGVAAYGMILRDSKYKGTADLAMVKSLVEDGIKGYDPYEYRADFLSLVETTGSYLEDKKSKN